jgi:hypothetical protein
MVSGPDDPRPGADWDSFRAARDRFFAQLRPGAMDGPPRAICPDAPDLITIKRDGSLTDVHSSAPTSAPD